MSLYKRGGVWWYDFQILGIRIRQSTGLKSRSAASEAEALHRASLLQNPDQTKPNETSPKFTEFAIDEFAEWSENEHSEHPSTQERYMRSIKVLTRFFDQRTLDMISSGDVERFKIQRSKQRRKFAKDGRRVTPGTVNRDLAILRILFNLAIRMGKAKTNPVAGIKLLSESNLPMRAISRDEELAYLGAATTVTRCGSNWPGAASS